MKSKKPLIILGESFFKSNSANYLFNLIKQFLNINNKISNNWNPVNILSVDASMVGNLDLNIIVPSKITARIQECHIFLGHHIFESVENLLIKKKK